MKNKLSPFLLLLSAVLLQIVFCSAAVAQVNNSRNFEERFVIQSVRKIHSAQATYQATAGKGVFGTFAQLRQADLIDEALASGNKYGYAWALSVTHSTATQPARFTLTATPRLYSKQGRKSFFIDETGTMRGADKGGAAATVSDPVIFDCALYGANDNERCTILDLRMLNSAEMTYQSTSESGDFGDFPDLIDAGLIPRRFIAYVTQGYSFKILIEYRSDLSPAKYSIYATPTTYGATGFRSFYINQTGVLRGADKYGQPADETDPPVED